jgi:hypothetical protein
MLIFTSCDYCIFPILDSHDSIACFLSQSRNFNAPLSSLPPPPGLPKSFHFGRCHRSVLKDKAKSIDLPRSFHFRPTHPSEFSIQRNSVGNRQGKSLLSPRNTEQCHFEKQLLKYQPEKELCAHNSLISYCSHYP